MTRESAIERAVVSFAQEMGWRVRKVGYIGRRGAPDRWFFAPGPRLKIVEFKRPGERPDLLQQREIDRLREDGFDVHVIDNIEDGYALFRPKASARRRRSSTDE